MDNTCIQEEKTLQEMEIEYLNWLTLQEYGETKIKAFYIAKKHFGPNQFNLFITNGYKQYLLSKSNN